LSFMGRFFSKSQKVDLYLAAGGKCMICGVTLPTSWHADHVKPWAKGGETDVLNGAALCPKCNQRKGDFMAGNDFQLPRGLKLRDWQQEFLEGFFDKVIGVSSDPSTPNYLLVATPGAGKTVAQLSAAYTLFQQGIIDWIILCVPTDHLRNQMGQDAHERFGLDLYHGTGFVPEGDYHGEVVTYAQVAANHGVWRNRCANKRVFLSSDEVHHLGDELAWGAAYKEAFSEAKIRLSTSGTPFRTDNQQIPWISYEPAGDGCLKSKADYHYGYGEALKEGVCRHVVFPTFDAACRWLYGFDMFAATFQDKLNQSDSSRRRNVAIDADSDWMSKVFHDAQLRLDIIRESGHPDAGGLIVCKDKVQAAMVAEKVKAWTGEQPILVNSDMPDASQKIKKFASEHGGNASRWLVAVKMVSEGVDIKRLRVAIYATNIITEMYFRQFVGRVIRMIGLEEETAYVYAYPDPELIEFMEQIKAERDHVVKEMGEDDKQKRDGQGGNGSGTDQLKFFQPVEANGFESDHIYGGTRYSALEIAAVKEMALELGLPEAKVLFIRRRLAESGNIAPPTQGMAIVPKTPGPTKKERVQEKRKVAGRLTNKLAYGILEVEAIEVHSAWKRYTGKTHENSSEDVMDRKIHWLKCCIAAASIIPPADVNWTQWEELKNA